MVPPSSDARMRNRYTDRFLEPFRQQGDPLADAVLAGLGGRVRTGLLARVEVRARREGGVYREFLDACHAVPRWADFSAMEAGRRVGFKYAPAVGLALMAGSLVEGYALGNAAEVLVATGRLTQDVQRRLHETSDFVYKLALPGGIRPGQDGHRGVMKVRLLHAAIRAHLSHSPRWNREALGLPINQEDMAITLIQFGFEVRRGLMRLGIRLTEEEQDSQHLFWRYAGHVLGVDSALLTKTRQQEEQLYEAITRRQRRVTENSVLLTRAVLDGMSGLPPFYMPRATMYQLSRKLLGAELADELQIPRSLANRGAVKALTLATRTLKRTERTLPLVSTALYQLGRFYLLHAVPAGLEGTNPEYNARVERSAN
ncbi:MAG: DUF2236 domain-containing protein [Candidatus Hydrogenedens sp.]|nr:DUF2236 domain-containing protein [Candidatus Hydrogenedens sp.]